jgi:hypothetical protein
VTTSTDESVQWPIPDRNRDVCNLSQLNDGVVTDSEFGARAVTDLGHPSGRRARATVTWRFSSPLSETPSSTDPAVPSVPDLLDPVKKRPCPLVKRSTLDVCGALVTQALQLLAIHDLKSRDCEDGSYRRRV